MLPDITGNHPFLFACISNRVDNVKFWLKRFPEWDLEKTNQIYGGFALGCAVYMGANRLYLTELLLKKGAKPDSVTFGGSSILHSVCSNPDADLRALRLLLKHEKVKSLVNYQEDRRNRKTKKILYTVWDCIDV